MVCNSGYFKGKFCQLLQHGLDDQFDPIINHIKGLLTSRCQLDLKLLAFFCTIAQGGQVSKAQLKRDLDQLGKDLYNIDL